MLTAEACFACKITLQQGQSPECKPPWQPLVKNVYNLLCFSSALSLVYEQSSIWQLMLAECWMIVEGWMLLNRHEWTFNQTAILKDVVWCYSLDNIQLFFLTCELFCYFLTVGESIFVMHKRTSYFLVEVKLLNRITASNVLENFLSAYM